MYACILAYNEMSILPHTLPFDVEHYDRLIVIEGSPQGSSTDGTWDWLNENYGNNKKVSLLSGNWGEHTKKNNWNIVRRNLYIEILDKCKNKPYFIHSKDADETYTEHFMKEVRKEVETCKDSTLMIRFPYHQFYYDFWHEYKGYDSLHKYSHHLTKYLEGMRYIKKNSWLYDANGRKFEDFPINSSIIRNDLHMFHYSHAESADKQKYREWRYAMRQDFDDVDISKLPSDHRDYKFVDRRQLGYKSIQEFTGDHPEHMIPYIKKECEERGLECKV